MGRRRCLVAVAWRTVALLCLSCAIASAQVPVPELRARVTDQTATLTAEQIAGLDADLAALEQRKGAQIAVLMIATLSPAGGAGVEDIAAFATRVFDGWKLGRKGVDDGVLIVVAKDDHRVRIEIGYGLEGAIPDAAAARIIREYMAPRFREGDWAGGIREATAALTGLVDGESLPAPLDGGDATREVPADGAAPSLGTLLGVAFASLMLGFLLAATLKCLFNIFPVRVLPIGARRAIGLLAGPAIIATVFVLLSRSPDTAPSIGAATGTMLLLPVGITGWLGWSMAADGASNRWGGGITLAELVAGIFYAIVSLALSIVTGGLLEAVGGGGGRGGGFSGGGGKSGGGGASGSW